MEEKTKSTTVPVEFAEGINVREYVRIIFKRRNMIVSLFLITMITVFIGNYIAKPVFISSAKILLEGPKGVDVPYTTGIKEFQKIEITQTQSMLMKSTEVLEKVVRALNLDKREEEITFKDKVRNIIRRIIRFPRYLYIQFRIFIDKLIKTYLLKEKASKEEVITPSNAEEEAKKKAILSELKESIGIDSITNTDLISVSVTGSNPDLITQISNTLTRIYIQHSLDVKSEDAITAYRFINDQVKIANEKLKRAEMDLERYKAMTGIISMPAEVSTRVKALADFEAALNQTHASRIEIESNANQIRKELTRVSNTTISGTTISRNPLIDAHKGRLVDLEVQLAGLRARYKDKHPEIISMKNRIEQVKESLKNEVKELVSSRISSPNPIYTNLADRLINYETQAAALAARERALVVIVENYKAKLEGLSEKEMELTRLQRAVTLCETSCINLLQKQEDALLAEALKLTNIRIIEPAEVPKSPIKPKKTMNLMIGAIVSLLVGFGLCFFLEYVDHSMETPEAVYKYLRLPVLGSIPKNY
ncbi:MAG: GNVR domain-containing protein [bacterium]|nr:GNVR domain-containing protein [bacterium]